jgi:hypothetical protein
MPAGADTVRFLGRDLDFPDHLLLIQQTVSSLGTFILAMTMYPEVQKKAQAAIDAVVGSARLPDFQDDIPYIDAVLREVLRWRPVTPLSKWYPECLAVLGILWIHLLLGLPHAVTENDVYKGYHIPVGTVVVANAW